MTEALRFGVAAAMAGFAVLMAHRLVLRQWSRRLLDDWARAEGAQIMLCRSLTRLPWPLMRHGFRVMARDAHGRFRNARVAVRPWRSVRATRVEVRWDERR